MKALILAGGYATRLRPLSFSKPKLLFPIMGKPLLERTLENLSAIGVDEVILAVNYLADHLEEHFGERHKEVKVHYSFEEEALGTAGPIKKAEEMLWDEDYFFTMNGDILFSLEIGKMREVHQQGDPTATIALHEVEDPSRFGVAVLDKEMYIRKFVEKPPKGFEESKLINAGIYLFTPEIFKYISPGKKVSTETEVFPKLAQEKKLLGFKYQGEWYDIGKIEDYISANYGRLERYAPRKPLIQDDSTISDDVTLKTPIMICRNSIIGSGSKIGPYTILGEEASIGSHVQIENSILFDRVKVGSRSRLDGCVLGEKVELGENVCIGRGVVIADGVKVREGIRIIEGVNICPFKEVTENIREKGNIL